MIDMLLQILIILAVAVAIAMVLRWALPMLGVPQPIINAILLVLAVVVLVWIIRMFLGGSGSINWRSDLLQAPVTWLA